jgi:hypothetical protein
MQQQLLYTWESSFTGHIKIKSKFSSFSSPRTLNFLYSSPLNNKEIYVIVKNPTIKHTIRLHRLCLSGDVQRVEGIGLGMYREWKEIELCWFGDVQRIEGKRIVLVWGCTENGRKFNCVGLGMYREWKETELCRFGDVQRME